MAKKKDTTEVTETKETKSKHKNLSAAKTAKNDEFYTLLSDINSELKNYEDKFEGKIVYCNCDDCFQSNFFRYFAINFSHLKLKKLIATCYAESKVATNFVSGIKEKDKVVNQWFADKAAEAGKVFGKDKLAYKMVQEKGMLFDENGDPLFSESINNGILQFSILKGDGSYDSPECMDLLKEADIIVTNPPFSLFRDFVKTLEDNKKEYIIVGNKNALTYKEIFPLIKDNKMWLGITSPKEFKKPDGTITSTMNGLCRWFTNIEHDKRNEKLILKDRYVGHEEDFPKYDNYDAINVDDVKNIPDDYDGVIDVPITFIDKYCPEQFEIIGLLNSSNEILAGMKSTRNYADFIEIKQDGNPTGSKGGKTNGNPVLSGRSIKGNYYINTSTKEEVHSIYARVLIKKKPKKEDK